MKTVIERSSDWFEDKMREKPKPINNPLMYFNHKEQQKYVRVMRQADPHIQSELEQVGLFVVVMGWICIGLIIAHVA